MRIEEKTKIYERITMMACLSDEFKRLNKRTDELLQMSEGAKAKGDVSKLIVYEAEMAMILRIMELLISMQEDTMDGLK